MVTPVEQDKRNPDHLTVLMTGPDGTAKPAYRARVLVADGYLDLAVLRIDATADGSPLPASGLHLPSIPLGDSHQSRTGDPLTVVGFPGVADSDQVNVTRGVISTFVPEPLGRTHSDRWEIETDARIAHGNSGGAAIDEQGRLIGIPSSGRQRNGDTSWRARAIELANPLIAKARQGSAAGYVTPYAVASTGSERWTTVGYTSSKPTSCQGGVATIDAKASMAYAVLELQGLAAGEDVGYVLSTSDGEIDGGMQVYQAGQDCAVVPLGHLPAGTYFLTVYAGPLMRQLATDRVESVG
jgi:putative serine protease PepD